MMERDRIECASQAQDDVAPTLASRRTMVEFAQEAPELRLIGVELLDTGAGKPVEDAKLLLAEPLINDKGMLLGANAPFGLD